MTGCRSWDVRAFDVPLPPKEPRLMAASEIALVAANVGIGVVIQTARHR